MSAPGRRRHDLAGARAARGRGRAAAVPALDRDLPHRDVPRPAPVRAARARAAAAAAGGRRAGQRVVGRAARTARSCTRSRSCSSGSARWSARCSSAAIFWRRNLAVAQVGAFDGVSDAVRARVRFEQRDLVSDGPPPGRWQLVLCRNVAIYHGLVAASGRTRTSSRRSRGAGCCSLGRSERLIDPSALGLRVIGPHAY